MKILAVFSWILAAALLAAPLAGATESDVDRLLDLLVKKGVVTQDDASTFRAELAIKKQEEKDLRKEFAVLAGKPINISGYTQGRFRQGKDIKDSFDIRRARLDLKGDITERFDYRTQVEFGGQSGPFLLDAAIGYKFDPALKITAGQFKIPFSLENLTSSPKLETINRSQVVEALVARGADVIGNQNGRDIGVQASGSLFPVKDFNLIDYAFGIFNGAGINKLDTNDQKDLIGRLLFHPVKDLSIGGSFYKGEYTLSGTSNRYTRDRVGAEIAYIHDRVSLKAEYIAGQDDIIKKHGWYAQAGYFIIPKTLQGVFKYDSYDPNLKTGIKDQVDIYTFGLNYFFNKWAFLQLNYELKHPRKYGLWEGPSTNAFLAQMTLQF